jgi:hypothetical protein
VISEFGRSKTVHTGRARHTRAHTVPASGNAAVRGLAAGRHSGNPVNTVTRSSVKSAIAAAGPSRPTPESFTPP